MPPDKNSAEIVDLCLMSCHQCFFASRDFYRYRVTDGNHARWLRSCVGAVNFVWNWCHGAQKHAIKHNRKWPSGFDLNKLSSGCGSETGTRSQTIQAICEKYADSRKISNRAYLQYRGKKSRGWVPFKASGIKIPGWRCHLLAIVSIWCVSPNVIQSQDAD